MTATATLESRGRIADSLRFARDTNRQKQWVEVVALSCERKELYIIVIKTAKQFGPSFWFQWRNKAVVFCATKRRAQDLYTETTAQIVTEADRERRVFLLTSANQDKGTVVSAFCDSDDGIKDAKYMIATDSFGLGVNVPDINVVWHDSPPDSLLMYLQHLGRAGRNGTKSLAVLFYSPNHVEDKKEATNADRKNMAKYLATTTCRTLTMRNLMGEDVKNAENCMRCDNCAACHPELQ